MSNKSIETFFQILAAILMGVAAFFLWQENYEGVFVSSVLSSVSYFLSYRFQVKERLDIREAEKLERELEEMNMNRNILQENTSLFDFEKTDFEKLKEKVLKDNK
jgi:hypothetical protein